MHRIPITLLALAACRAPRAAVSPGPGEPPPAVEAPELRPDAEPTPWTEEFLAPAVLMADRILVEGPAGLFEHAVARGDDALFERSVTVVPEGLRQVVRPRASGQQPEIVRAQLDAWQLAAFREVVFLERVDPDAAVVVRALGDAVWRDTDGNEQREAQLTFRGEVASPSPEQ
jgi:hypothetical protein